MGIPVIIYGKSGSGKSRSLKNFNDDEIFYVNIEKKPLPFRKKFKYTFQSENLDTIFSGLSKMPTKTAVIDDATYIMVNKFMREHAKLPKGKSTFDLYNDIADSVWKIFEFIRNNLPEDVIVYIVMHEESNDFGETRIRTIGKLLDDKVVPEGIVTICLRCMSANGKHFFRATTNGSDITKAPEDMFETEEIENDLKFVDDSIREYYGFSNTESEEQNETIQKI